MTSTEQKPLRVSASQIKAFQRCPRLWWRQWPNGEKSPPSKGMILGKQYHAQLEQWSKHGIMPPHPLPQCGIPHIPPPQTEDVFIEHRFMMDSDHAPILGYIDVLDVRGPHPVVIDHKFLANLKYARTGPQLALDTQMLLYGWHAIGDSKAADLVHLSYRRTGRPIVQRSSVTVTRDDLSAFWDGLQPVIGQMAVYYDAPTARAVPGHKTTPTHEACRMYGGCPFKHDCARAEGTLFAGVASKPKEQNPMIDRIETVFASLCEHDQRALLKGCSAKDVAGIAKSPQAKFALDAAERWAGLPTTGDLKRWLDLLADNELATVPRTEYQHPELRAKSVDKIRAFLGDSWGVNTDGKTTAGALEAFEEARAALDFALSVKPARTTTPPPVTSPFGLPDAEPETPTDLVTGETDTEAEAALVAFEAAPKVVYATIKPPEALNITLTTAYGATGEIDEETKASLAAFEAAPAAAINPPDATPNGVPEPPDPQKLPVTSVPGIGLRMGERMAEAMGLDNTPTIPQAIAWFKKLGPVVAADRVKGLSLGKIERIARAVDSDLEIPEVSPANCHPGKINTMAKLRERLEEYKTNPPPQPEDTPDLGAVVKKLQKRMVKEIKKSAKASMPEPGFSLFIDCVPIISPGGPVVRIETILAPLCAEIEKKEKTPHWNLLDYRKGPRALAHLLNKHLEKDDGLNGAIVLLSSSHPAGPELIEVCTAHARVVVRGVK